MRIGNLSVKPENYDRVAQALVDAQAAAATLKNGGLHKAFQKIAVDLGKDLHAPINSNDVLLLVKNRARIERELGPQERRQDEVNKAMGATLAESRNQVVSNRFEGGVLSFRLSDGTRLRSAPPSLVTLEPAEPRRQAVSADQLRQIMPGASALDVETFVAPLNQAMREWGIHTRNEQAAFLAAVAEGSVDLRHREATVDPAGHLVHHTVPDVYAEGAPPTQTPPPAETQGDPDLVARASAPAEQKPKLRERFMNWATEKKIVQKGGAVAVAGASVAGMILGARASSDPASDAGPNRGPTAGPTLDELQERASPAEKNAIATVDKVSRELLGRDATDAELAKKAAEMAKDGASTETIEAVVRTEIVDSKEYQSITAHKAVDQIAQEMLGRALAPDDPIHAVAQQLVDEGRLADLDGTVRGEIRKTPEHRLAHADALVDDVFKAETGRAALPEAKVRDQVKQMIQEGKSPEEVKAFLHDKACLPMTKEELRHVMKYASEENINAFHMAIEEARAEFDICNVQRTAAFLAQVGHETGDLKYKEEIASGHAYEGRRDLGNTQPGDGARYKGRGLIQLTGRANYASASEALGLDLVNHPELAAKDPLTSARIAAWFFQTRGLNEIADRGDIVQVSRRVNGGTNGLADRLAHYHRALEVLT